MILMIDYYFRLFDYLLLDSLPFNLKDILNLYKKYA